MAYFSTWRPHGNRVSKTRFITLINVREEPREREREREKKKEREDRDPGRAPCATRSCPGSARPGSDLILSDQIRISLSLFLSLCCFLAVVKALNEIKASLGWRVVYAWVGDNPCGDGDLPPWSSVTCSTQGDYRFVTELYDSFFVSFGIFTI